jgi:hypothetical protein
MVMSTIPTDGQYNYEQELLDDSDSPPELPITYYTHLSERHVYKQLSNAGPFYAYVWFQPDQFDESRDNGEYKIIIRGTTFQHLAGTDDRIIEKFVSHSNTVVFVDCMFRDNGVEFKSNRDLRDCARWISKISGRFNGNKNEIYIVNADEDTLHHVNINEQTLALSIDSKTKSLACCFPRTAMMNGELPEDLPENVKEAIASSDGIADFDLPGRGTISNAYNTNFNSGSMRFSELRSKFGGSGATYASQYTRTRRIVAISQNNNVPIPGQTWRFSNLRGSVNGVVASCNGDFAHLKARWQVINNDLVFQNENFSKKIIITGHVGSLDAGQPAFRWNSTGRGVQQFRSNGKVYGYSGAGGNNNSGNGSNGGYALHIASPIEARASDWNNRIRGGGGGGGGGGIGGKGGGGGHSGVKRCSGWFCNSSKTKCRKDGGEGGHGGTGGHGGHGAGYSWAGNGWSQRHNGSRTGGSGGGGGSDRAGGKGGSGGDGGYGGNFGYNGNGGGKGQKGKDGGSDEHDCGYRGERSGKSGSNGGGGGLCVGTWSRGDSGSINFI